MITGLCILIPHGFGIFLVLVSVTKLEDVCLIFLIGLDFCDMFNLLNMISLVRNAVVLCSLGIYL